MALTGTAAVPLISRHFFYCQFSKNLDSSCYITILVLPTITNSVMDFSHDKSWDAFATIFKKAVSFSESWSRLIDFHEKIKAKKYWTQLRNVDHSQDQKEIKEWLNELPLKNPIPSSVKALWIGIAQLYDEKENKEFYAYYLQGADSYNENDIDWASEPSYEPEEKYFVPDILNNVRSKIKKDKNDFSFLDWILPLAYSSFLFNDILKTELDKSKFFNSQKQLFVTIGYDSGDFKELAPIKFD